MVVGATDSLYTQVWKSTKPKATPSDLHEFLHAHMLLVSGLSQAVGDIENKSRIIPTDVCFMGTCRFFEANVLGSPAQVALRQRLGSFDDPKPCKLGWCRLW